MIHAVGGGEEALESILERLPKSSNNAEFLKTLHMQV
jgi:hypothetical protein